MSEMLAYLFLAMAAAAFVFKVGAEIYALQVLGDVAAADRTYIYLAERAMPIGAWCRARLRKLSHWLCFWLHGGHELYRARTDTRLFQQCLLCGYETPGWTIDRRDRRLHLVASNKRNRVA